MGWDHNDQMREVGLGGGGTAYSTYDAAGQRVRKVWEHSGLVEERIYLGGWEVYRKRDSLRNLLLERETLHGMDGARRVVLVETKTVDVDASGAFMVVSRYRFQLDNHLGSASLAVNESGLVIGYEEYHPYGTTAYASGRSGVEVSGKRYRYTGKERDDETGLYYHGARHYAAWLGAWTSCDPKGIASGPSLYWYVRGNPVMFVDPDGRDPAQPNVESRNLQYSDPQAAANAVKAADWKPGAYEHPRLAKVQHIEQALMTSIANLPNTFVYGLKYIGLGLAGHIQESSSISEDGTRFKAVSKDETARRSLEETAEWRLTPPPGTESLSSAYDVVLPLVAGAVLGGNPKPGAGPPMGALLAETKETVSLVGAEVADAVPVAVPKAAPVPGEPIVRELGEDPALVHNDRDSGFQLHHWLIV